MLREVTWLIHRAHLRVQIATPLSARRSSCRPRLSRIDHTFPVFLHQLHMAAFADREVPEVRGTGEGFYPSAENTRYFKVLKVR